MAGFWKGVAQYVQEKNERDFRTSEREEEQQFQRELLQEKMRAERENLVFESLTKGRSFTKSGATGGDGKTPSMAPDHAVQVLLNRYNVPEELITNVAADGNPASLPRAVEILEKASQKYREIYGDDLPSEIINGMFENAITTQATENGIDWEAVEQYLGYDVDQEFKDSIGPVNVPGMTTFEEPVIRKKYTIEEIKQARDLAGQQVMTIATDTIQQASDEIARINSLLEDPTLDETTRSQYSTRAQAIGEQLNVEMAALEAAEKGNYLPLIKIYGNEAMSYLKEYYPMLSDAPLGLEFQ